MPHPMNIYNEFEAEQRAVEGRGCDNCDSDENECFEGQYLCERCIRQIIGREE